MIEVAAMMGKTDAAVAGLLRRGLQTLRRTASSESDGVPALARSDDAPGSATAALLAFLRRRDAGERVERASFLAEYTDCADELAEMLTWIDHIEGILPRQRES